MKLFRISGFIILLILTGCHSSGPIRFSTGTFTISIDSNGDLAGMSDRTAQKEYIAPGHKAPLLSVRMNDSIFRPSSMTFDQKDELEFNFDHGRIKASVKVTTSASHITFELTRLQPNDSIELVIWGPYPTTINKSIGETIGIVRGDEFAIGLQALNPRTLGGYPWNNNDCMPQLDIFENENYDDLNEEGKPYVLYRVEAAKPEDFGSTLQAYCRNRHHDRIIENMGHAHYVAPAYDDGGVIGSKIALFGCPVDKTLDYIENIELDEGLPHPMIDGVWAKKSPKANASYLIFGFGEADIDKAIGYTKKAGLTYLYQPGPFKTWGHFELKELFPHGIAGLKSCVDLAEKQGIHLGLHTLSNFITTNDAYVTPIPDDRLAKVGWSKTIREANDIQSEIEIESPTVFSQMENNNLKTVVIANELIRYGSVSEEAPWKLLDCPRGAFDTHPSAHPAGAKIALLADHGYKVFLSNAALSKEIAETMADLFNQTGLRQISFDGLEGNRSTGMGNYGEILMTSTWYDHLNDYIKSHYIADASRTSHYFWHIYTRMNWGEPWYAGFRESQTEYRFKNQKYFQRNLMPGMLGWFKFTGQTSLEDMEWMLAKAAGYQAGFGLVSSTDAFEENGSTDLILEEIKEWEKARLQHAFVDTIREKLMDIKNEFHLEKTGESQWLLTEFAIARLEHTPKERQPGEPLFSIINFQNPAENQDMNFILSAENGGVKNIILEMDGYKKNEIPVVLREGESLKYNGGSSIIHYSNTNTETETIEIEPLILKSGAHALSLDCTFLGGKETKLKLEVRMIKKTFKIMSPDEK